MRQWLLVSIVMLACMAGVHPTPSVLAQTAVSNTPSTLLHADELEKTLPATVFFRGQTAPIQLRNSAGVRFSDGALLLAAKVDTAGYASTVQEKYQDYLLTEVPLAIGDQTLPPGAYGVGFLAQDRFIVMDIGGHELFTTPSHKNPDLKRPTPLQMIAVPETGAFRLYDGRNYVEIKRAQAPK